MSVPISNLFQNKDQVTIISLLFGGENIAADGTEILEHVAGIPVEGMKQ